MREQYIARMARKYGLDPRAVLADARGEGLSGGVGDGGHAFGPFQMNNAGGVLTNAPLSHQNNKWAWSNQGINYALRNMAKVAGGLHGEAAVRAIVTRYERPADIQGAISTRLGYLHSMGAAPQGHPGGNHGPALASSGTRQSLVQMLMQQNTNYMSHQQIDPVLQQSILQNGLTKQDQQKMGNAPAAKGQSLPGGDMGTILHTAIKQVGTPYVWGGSKPGGFDCSGLIQYAYAKAGIALPRTTYDMIKHGQQVRWGQFKPGDLIFTNGGDHVVMYMGNGKAISAPHTGATVHTFNVTDIRSDFYAARRVTH